MPPMRACGPVHAWVRRGRENSTQWPVRAWEQQKTAFHGRGARAGPWGNPHFSWTWEIAVLRATSHKTWKVDAGEIPPCLLLEAASILTHGGLVIYPTETFYALGAVPALPEALARIYAVKGRQTGKPLPLIASRMEAALSAVSNWPESADVLAAAFWPGPLTLLLPAASSLPLILHAGTGKVAIRISSHPVAVLLAQLAGGLLVSTSANRSGAPPPDNSESLPPALLHGVEGLLDAGRLCGGLPSTIVDVTAAPPVLLRAGALDWNDISRALDAARH